ncbi:protein of unknown function [Pseudomonas sp. JV551A1]|uniref:Uncharacterized protein n=1 Tax=Pseudomonas inefficax TaxID=2078786 RepID=A0AAQ1P852_9PSED|nr:protein of unknown function [Pseudomonas sp. JV551A1]SPO61585.1 protein of unknown function [Pseudomonas inefficax]
MHYLWEGRWSAGLEALACAGLFAGKPAPTGIAAHSALCITCGSGFTREKGDSVGQENSNGAS